MKKSNYGKKHLFFKSNNVDKEKIALFLYLPIAVIALIICAVILLRSEKKIHFVRNFPVTQEISGLYLPLRRFVP